MADNETRWLTVHETAERLGHSEATIRRMIRAGELPASREGRGSRAPWVVSSAALEHQLAQAAEDAARRERLAGVVTGYGDDAFLERLEASPHSPETKQAIREFLLARAEREMDANPQFAHLDEEERLEEEAQELARRVRRAEQYVERRRARARAILDEENEPAHEQRTPA